MVLLQAELPVHATVQLNPDGQLIVIPVHAEGVLQLTKQFSPGLQTILLDNVSRIFHHDNDSNVSRKDVDMFTVCFQQNLSVVTLNF